MSEATQTTSQTASKRWFKFDSEWANPKLVWGLVVLLGIIALGILGRLIWDIDLVRQGAGRGSMAPFWFENFRGQDGVIENPFGTDNRGRDMLALLITAIPNTLYVGILASLIGMTTGIILGFTSGFLGGRTDDTIRVIADAMITIPPLLIMVVVAAVYTNMGLTLMALLIAFFLWQSPTRLIRAQVLSMRQSGYVQMARLSGASTPHIMFREMMPNLVPYLFGSFIANVTTAIVTAVGMEVLGLGQQQVPTLGRIIYDAIEGGALTREMWWWWGLPTGLLVLMFIGLLLVNLGLDEVSNPRLRKL